MGDFFAVTEENFQQQVLQSNIPVLLEFGAAWCQPCKRLEPILKQLGETWGERVILAKVDVDANANLAMQYQVMGVPTVILFSGGAVLERITGLQSRERLNEKFGSLF